MSIVVLDVENNCVAAVCEDMQKASNFVFACLPFACFYLNTETVSVSFLDKVFPKDKREKIVSSMMPTLLYDGSAEAFLVLLQRMRLSSLPFTQIERFCRHPRENDCEFLKLKTTSSGVVGQPADVIDIEPIVQRWMPAPTTTVYQVERDKTAPITLSIPVNIPGKRTSVEKPTVAPAVAAPAAETPAVETTTEPTTPNDAEAQTQQTMSKIENWLVAEYKNDNSKLQPSVWLAIITAKRRVAKNPIPSNDIAIFKQTYGV